MSILRNGFQTFVQQQPAPAVVGDFASMNPRATALAGPGAFKAAGVAADAAGAVIVGNFAWGTVATGIAHGVETAGSILGFIANELQTVITAFLGQSRLAVQEGFPVTLYTHGDFWADVQGGVVAVGDPIYARATDGAPTVDEGVSGANPATGYVAMTAKALAASAATSTVAAGTGVATLGVVTNGPVQVGDNVTGTGVPPNLFVQAILTGNGGTGSTLQLNTIGPAIASATLTFSRGGLVKISRTY